ncbi:hypothetical protein [Phenylobacterium immobile]|uniref:hypothetical protein n=1 Tax=Phenylobacterium immobile TaxID=21 RepID=UPI000B1B74FB|nr:hypothetical protein [Phenylobacterium immobile]
MRPLGLGLVAALAISLLAPLTANAKDAVSADQRKKGMAEAPAVVQAAGLNCQVADARFLGVTKDAKTKVNTSYYEVDCGASQIGYIVQSTSDGVAPKSFSCLEANSPTADGKPSSLSCILPGNVDVKAKLGAALRTSNVTCTPDNFRGIGQSPTQTFAEVGCTQGPGYILIGSAPLDLTKPIEAQDCLNYDTEGSAISCTLSDKAKRIAVVDTYAAAANNGCAVKDRGFLGTSRDGSTYFEAACQDGKGYVYKVSAGALAQTIECAKAQPLFGGCKLTDARAAETEQAGLYTRLAKSAGSTCDVTRYAIFPTSGSDEAVELVCANGKGAVGLFKASGAGSKVLDCAHALIAGYKCGLTNTTDWGTLTADLNKLNVKSCVVSNARVMGKTAAGVMLVETACADGYKGYVIDYDAATLAPVKQTGCAFSADCKLPGNT